MVSAKNIEDSTQDAYDAVDDAMPDLLAMAKTAADVQAITSRRDTLRDIFWRTQSDQLKDFNATVQHLYDELDTVNQTLKADLKALQDIASALKLVTEVIKLAGALVIAASA